MTYFINLLTPTSSFLVHINLFNKKSGSCLTEERCDLYGVKDVFYAKKNSIFLKNSPIVEFEWYRQRTTAGWQARYLA